MDRKRGLGLKTKLTPSHTRPGCSPRAPSRCRSAPCRCPKRGCRACSRAWRPTGRARRAPLWSTWCLCSPVCAELFLYKNSPVTVFVTDFHDVFCVGIRPFVCVFVDPTLRKYWTYWHDVITVQRKVTSPMPWFSSYLFLHVNLFTQYPSSHVPGHHQLFWSKYLRNKRTT